MDLLQPALAHNHRRLRFKLKHLHALGGSADHLLRCNGHVYVGQLGGLGGLGYGGVHRYSCGEDAMSGLFIEG